MSNPTYRSLILADSPSLYWPLDATYGATDQSGNGRNGTGAGGVSIGGYSGSPISDESTATDFDNTDDRITSTYAAFVNGSVRTFEGWAWRDGSTDTDTLFGATGQSPYLDLSSGSQNVVFDPSINDAGGTVTWTSAWPGNAQWVHWALVFSESADTVSLYINGALVSTQAATQAYNAGVGVFQVAARAAANFFDGKMAHVAVYERALTASEIQSHYQRGQGQGLPVLRSYAHQAGRGQ